MKRLFCLAAVALVLTGCNVASVQRMYEGAPRAPAQVALIVTQMTPSTAKLLKGAFGSTPHLRAASLHAVDGREGTTTFGGYKNIYNNDWDWSLKVEVLPGQHALVVMPNHYMDESRPKASFEFTAKPGHQYFLGQIMETQGLSYEWTPVLVDQTDNVLVYPMPVEWKPSGK
jgi:hypothetical protein